jgi:hypothetical protein
MAAEAGRETRQGAESDEDSATDATGLKIATQHTKPKGFINSLPAPNYK